MLRITNSLGLNILALYCRVAAERGMGSEREKQSGVWAGHRKSGRVVIRVGEIWSEWERVLGRAANREIASADVDDC